MPIAFLCHYCGRRIEAPRGQAGQSMACACGVTLTVPRPTPAQQGKTPPKPQARPIVFACPHCKKRFKVDATSAGQTIPCSCGVNVIVPSAKRPAEAKPEIKPRATGTISFNCNHCRKRFKVPTDLAGQKGRCECGLAYVVPIPSALKAKRQAEAAEKAAQAAEAAEKPEPPKPKDPDKQVVFTCPRCKRPISLPASQTGRKAKCTCGARFVVPARGGRPPVELTSDAHSKTPEHTG